MRLRRSSPAEGFERLEDDLYVRAVPAAECAWVRHVIIVCMWRSAPFRVCAERQDELLVEYIGDDTTAFNDPVRGEELSTAMYDQGAEIIYHAAGASGAGLFNAAVEADSLAIGVDSDQYLTASPEQQPLILTSMLKRVDTAVYTAIEGVGSGTFGGSLVFGMAEDGLDYSASNPDELTSDITAQLDEFKQQIIDGEIVVPDSPA